MIFLQALSYYLAHHTLGSKTQLKVLKEIVSCLRARSLFPIAITLDQCQTNMKMFREGGATQKRPFLKIDGEQVAVIFDPPHLLKSARNMLYKHNAVFQDEICSFSYIKQLFELDQVNIPRLCPRLTEECITLPPFTRMNVPKAVRTLSGSTGSGIRFLIRSNDMTVDAKLTAEYAEFHDKLFDSMNSKSIHLAKVTSNYPNTSNITRFH